MLECIGDDGNVIRGEHIRMRGVPTSCIKYKAGQGNITVLGIHTNLYKGAVIEFDLNNDLTKFVCKGNRDHAVSKVTDFTRTTRYIRDGKYTIFIG